MTPERRRALTLGIGLIYLASFVLPVFPDGMSGGWIFLYAFLIGVYQLFPAMLIAWSANVFFVIGLGAFRAGRHRQAARLGLAALGASLPAIGFQAYGISTALAEFDLAQLLTASGYFAWMLALTALAVVALGTSNDSGRFHIQLRLRWLMIAVAVIAVVLGGWPILGPVLYWNRSNGLGAPF